MYVRMLSKNKTKQNENIARKKGEVNAHKMLNSNRDISTRMFCKHKSQPACNYDTKRTTQIRI